VWQVAAVRDYLGLLLIQTFEQRRQAAVLALQAQSPGMTDTTAEQQVSEFAT
jgi:hypothetical protein